MPINTQNITAVTLASGQKRLTTTLRLGGLDKGLIELNKIPLVQHLINRLQTKVSKIIISANRHLDTYRDPGFPVYMDEINGFAGPHAGTLKALQECKSE